MFYVLSWCKILTVIERDTDNGHNDLVKEEVLIEELQTLNQIPRVNERDKNNGL